MAKPIVDEAACAIDYYARAFGAKELGRMGAPGGQVGDERTWAAMGSS